MKETVFFLLITFVLSLISCNQENDLQNEYIEDSSFINNSLSGIKSAHKIDSLFDLGLYNLAYEVIYLNLGAIPDASKIRYAENFAENGEFDKGNQLITEVAEQNNEFELLNFSLYCALKKQDNVLAQKLFNDITKQYGNDLNIEKKISLMLSQAYLEHNKKNYLKAIQLNEQSLEIINEKKLPEKYRLKVHRLLGNDYNDIVRNNIEFSLPKKTCYQKGLSNYEKESELLKNIDNNRTRIALNRITTAMLSRAFIPKDKIIDLYSEAIELLIVSNEQDFILTRNPIYASIALTQLGAIYFEQENVIMMDSVLSLNKKLIGLRSYYKVKDNQSLDIWEYFPQISEERKILFELKYGNRSVESAIKCLAISSNSKYINHNLDQNILKEFGSDGTVAVKNWILLNELSIYQYFQNCPIKQKAIVSRLKKYVSKIKKINARKEITFDNNKIELLRRWCIHNDATIVDFQVLYGGSVSKVIIDKKGISIKFLKPSKILSTININLLIESIQNRNILTYHKISNEILNKLELGSVSTQNLLVCPDEFLEKIPFDALIMNCKTSENWSNLLFFGKNKNIHLVPNLFSVLNFDKAKSPIKINFWHSKSENKTLPFNQRFIDDISNEFPTTINTSESDNILHVLGHTYFTEDKGLEFRKFSDTISTKSIGRIHPRLVILHGCKSGNGKNLKLEGSISMTRGFLYNGTPSVIYSLWDADNQSSTALFKLFYMNLKKGYNTSEALNKAKYQIKSDVRHPDWANPYYWANFQFTGQDLSFFH
jgi:hypothetical protein